MNQPSSSPRTLRLTGLNLFFGLLIFIVIFNAVFLYINFRSHNVHQRRVQHTYEVLNQLTDLLLSIRESETSMRGHLLTRNPVHLEVFEESKARIWKTFANIKTLTNDNPAQQEHLTALESLIEKRIKYLDSNIEKYFHLKSLTLLQDTLSQEQILMATLTQHINNIKTVEFDLLESRNRQSETSRFYFLLTLAITKTLILIAISMGYLQIRRNQIKSYETHKEKSTEAWIQTHFNEINQIFSIHTDLQKSAQAVLDYLADKLKIWRSNLYVIENSELVPIASYGTQENENNKTYKVGEGLIGEAVKFSGLREIDDIPPNYFTISSSLGRAKPSKLFFLPLEFRGKKIGIVELALFKIDAETKKLLEHLHDPLSIGINASIYQENQQALLDKTQRQAEELQTQQEELRTTNEELEQQTRALEAQQQFLNIKNKELEIAQLDAQERASDLEKANQYKSEFLAKMSHELRTPLNSLLILSTLLIENKENNLTSQQKEFAISIQNAGNDLLNLINDILDLSKIEARKLSMRPGKFSLSNLVDQIKLTFQQQIKSKKLDFKINIDKSLSDLKMDTDKQRIEQILRNFLSNAIKFTEKGFIKLNVIPSPTNPKNICFVVEDSGIGIPSDKQKLIFEAFEQADGSVSRKYGGTGLGLTISRELSQLLGGTISLLSESNKGSIFTLEVPIELDMASQNNIPEPFVKAFSSGNKANRGKHPKNQESDENTLSATNIALNNIIPDDKTILIIEDDAPFRRSVADAVKSYNFTPIEIEDGEIALEVLKRHVPTAILLDIKLPGISGLGLLEMIKQIPHMRHVPIHMISALEYQQSALRLGAMGYLGKPVTIDKIRSALSRIESLVSQKVRKLLIIEDDNRQSKAIQQLVSGPDIESQIVHTGNDAIKIVQETNFDCIILDLSLPDISGFDLLDKLSELNISVPPIVIYTGKDLTRQEEEYLRKYSESIIIKGAKSPERLLDEVNLFLHRVETLLPEDKRAMLTQLRSQEKYFDNKNVLIVDDDMRNVFALTSALESKGFNVSIARDGLEALDLLKKQPNIDIVLMDIMMPRMNGYEAMEAIRKDSNFKELPIIALTAKAMKEDHEKCIKAGASDYLPKPINLNNLFSVLKVWLTPKGIFK